MKLLDLYCGVGGGAMGYAAAGFEVTGIDIKPQPRYPFPFIQGNALRPPVDLEDFDVIHASPPCEGHSTLRALQPDRDYPDLIPSTREMLLAACRPFVIENVATAPLASQPTLDGAFGIRLCGSMFGLGNEDGQLRRHRLFESNVPLWQPSCRHRGQAVTVSTKRHAGKSFRQTNQPRTVDSAREIMQMPWSDRYGMGKAIPPAYAEFIGHQLMEQIGAAA